MDFNSESQARTVLGRGPLKGGGGTATGWLATAGAPTWAGHWKASRPKNAMMMANRDLRLNFIIGSTLNKAV